MSDLSTLPRAKDWLLITVIGLLFTMVGIIAADNRRLILENRRDLNDLRQAIYQLMAERVTRLEGQVMNLQQERDRWKRRSEE